MPNQSISLSSYDPEAARIQRQMRLAEMLQQQAMDPLQPVSPNAPISPLSVLGKVLQAYGSKRNLDKADTDYADLQTKRQQQLAESLQNFGKSYKTVDAGAAQAQEPGGEPLQQYAMAQPTQEQKLLEAIKIGNINTPGAQEASGYLMAQNTPKYTSVRDIGLVNTNGPDGKPVVEMPVPPKAPEQSEAERLTARLAAMPKTDPQYKDLSDRLRILNTRQGPTTVVTMGSNGIDYGKPEEGLVWKRDQSGKVVIDENGAPIAIPYQGGKAYNAAKSADETARNRQAQSDRGTSVVTEDIDRILDIVKKSETPVTGAVGAVAKNIPWSNAGTVKSLLSGVKANIGFDRLQQMRMASPSGGALGPVSDFENKLLQSVYGELEQSTNQETFTHNLVRLKKLTQQIANEGINPDGTPKLQRKLPDSTKPPLGSFWSSPGGR